MSTITAAAIASTARLLAPLVSDIYKNAKGKVQTSLSRWQTNSFPKKLAKKIHRIEMVKTLWSPEDDISLQKFYYPARIQGFDRKNGRSIRSIEELAEGNFVIQGIVGQGKSILLRYIALSEAIKKERSKLPIFLELRTLTASLKLRSAIYRELATFDIDVDDDSFDYIARSGRAIIFLDGFDELVSDQVAPTLNEILFLVQKYPELQFIVTSRPGNEIQKITGFRIINISPLNRNDYGPFLRKLGLDAIKTFGIIEAIKNSPSKIADLITTPLMLTLVVIVYQTEKEIPPTLPEFFERLFQVVFTRHDRLKPGFERSRHSGLSERRLQNLFEAFCFMSLQNGFGRSLSSEDFFTAFDQATQYTEKCECDVEKFRLDIVKVACLMLEEGIDTTTFLHKSVLEYYAAAFIKHSTDEVATLFYRSAPDNIHTWREVVRFLKDIDPYRYSKEFSIPEIESIRREFISPLKNKNKNSLISTIGKIYPDLSISYARIDEDTDEYEIISIGTFKRDIKMAYDALTELLIKAIQQQTPTTMNQAKLSDLFQAIIDENDVNVEYEIPFWKIINSCGPESFWSAIGIFESGLEQSEQEASSVIELHEKRKLIFKKKK